ncbi:MAG: VOC family protein [Nocardioidaceae bacterium]
MDLSLTHCFINVHDPDLALAFYRDVLGLEMRNDVANGGYRWVTVSPSAQPEVEIVLTDYVCGSPDDSNSVRALVAKGALNGVVFRTPDLDGTFEQVQASGAEVLQEPTDQPYGTRDCAFRDPSGNMVRIAQSPAS